ncbi:MAG: ABC transporter permease [Bacillota bacterium]
MILNPILAKEFRSRMRTWRAPMTVGAYVLLLGLVGFAYFRVFSSSLLYGGYINPQVGLQIFYVLGVFQLILVAFVTPSLTSGLISGERERQTLDLLLCTRLSATSIVLGKLLSAVSYVLLLIIAAVPVYSLVFLFGGVSPRELLMTLLIYVVTAVTYAAVGLFSSALFRRTQVSTLVTYAIIFSLVFGTLMAAGLQMAVSVAKPRPGPYGGPQLPAIVGLNPLVALLSVMPQSGSFYVPFFPISILGGGYGAPQSTVPAWALYIITSGILAVLMVLASIHLVKPVRTLSLKRIFSWRPWFKRRGRAGVAPAGGEPAGGQGA